jgi:hypothetical protein
VAAAAAADEEPFDSSKLRAQYHYNDGKTAHLWDERYGETRGISKFYSFAGACEMNNLYMLISRVCLIDHIVIAFTEVIAYHSKMEARDLPLSKSRTKKKGRLWERQRKPST